MARTEKIQSNRIQDGIFLRMFFPLESWGIEAVDDEEIEAHRYSELTLSLMAAIAALSLSFSFVYRTIVPYLRRQEQLDPVSEYIYFKLLDFIGNNYNVLLVIGGYASIGEIGLFGIEKALQKGEYQEYAELVKNIRFAIPFGLLSQMILYVVDTEMDKKLIGSFGGTAFWDIPAGFFGMIGAAAMFEIVRQQLKDGSFSRTLVAAFLTWLEEWTPRQEAVAYSRIWYNAAYMH